MNNKNQLISVYIDKENRKEYITYTRFLAKYKHNFQGVDLYLSQKEINEAPKYNQFETNENNLYYQKNEREFAINTAGTLLVDFLNIDFGNIESVKKYVDKYGIFILNSLCDNNINLKRLYSYEEYNNLIEDLFTKYSQEIELIKSDFIRVIDYIYNLYGLKEIEEFTPYERYYTLSISRLHNTINKYSNNLHLDFKTDVNSLTVDPAGPKEKYIYEQINVTKKEKKLELINSPYFISSEKFSNILYITLIELISIKEFPIKKCQNCDKYFVPQKRTDEIYCNNIFKDGLTCRQIGSKLFKKKKLQDEDSIDRLYRNAYQQKFLRMQRNPNNKEYKLDFEWFKIRVKDIRKEIKDGTKTDEDFKKWLLNAKDKGRFEW